MPFVCLFVCTHSLQFAIVHICQSLLWSLSVCVCILWRVTVVRFQKYIPARSFKAVEDCSGYSPARTCLVPRMQAAMCSRSAEVRSPGTYLGFLEWVI